jgi:hypothetical protein
MRCSAFRIAFFLPFLIVGCKKSDEITTYRIPKETGMSMANLPPGAAQEAQKARRAITWKTPADWKELPPSAMRAGSFSIPGAQGKSAEVSVIALSGEAGGALANINRWRGQILLEPITLSALPALSKTISLAGRRMQLVDFSSEKSHQRVIAAIYTRGDRTWFFKMMGDEATVGRARPAFLKFLESLQFHD